MMKCFKILVVVAAFFVFPLLTEAQVSEKMFASPTREYGPMTWWHWINGNVTRDGIRNDLIAMHRNGMRGVQMFNVHIYLPKGPVKFGSDQWVELVKYAVETCDSLGMKFVAMNSAGWSGAGGPWITPERAMKKLVFVETNVKGGQKVDVTLPMPKVVAGYYRDVAVMAVPAQYGAGQIADLDKKMLMSNSVTLNAPKTRPTGNAIPRDRIIDLTGKMDTEGRLEWQAPEGEWTVIRFGYTPTGKKAHPNAWGGEGYECNKLDAEDVAFQFDRSLGKLLAATKKYLGNTFEGILFDSYEAHWQNWTSKLPARFKELNGYDLLPWLPLFTGRYVEEVAKSERVLWDFRHTLDRMLAENYFGTMQRLAHENHLVVYAEGQGGPVSPQYVTDYIDIPMNEFWMPDAKPRITRIKLTSSLGNAQDKQIIAAEAFTSKPEDAKWQNTPWKMKKVGDLAFTGGINRYCFHTYAHQPFDHLVPGFTMGRYGTMFNRHLTWWDYAGDWFAYISRSQYLLQQGRTLADVGFLFHDDIRYNFSSGMVTLPPGYDYQIVYPESLVGAKVEDGDIVLSCGMRFKVLVIADDSKMNLGTLKLLSDLVRSGATLSGQPPVGIPSGYNWNEKEQAEFDALVDRMWSGLDGKVQYVKNYGKGVIYRVKRASDVVGRMGFTPDVGYGEADVKNTIYHIHRMSPQEDIYFLVNQSERSLPLELSFRVTGHIPEIWDPVTGQVGEAPVYEVGKETTSVKYEFAPYGSVFVVFREKLPAGVTAKGKDYRASVLQSTMMLDKDWTIRFADKRQKIEDPVKTDALFLWNENKDERIMHYSGTGIYTTTFTVDAGRLAGTGSVRLDLGSELYDIASVTLNGKSLGTVWTKPYVIDITEEVRAGENRLEIRVANTWINRVIGDEALPDDAEYQMSGSKFTIGRAARLPEWAYGAKQMPADRERVTYATWKHYDANSPLVPSGMPGPVKVEFYSK